MIQAKKRDKNQVVRIITECFANNPGVNFIIGKGGNKTRKLRALAEYAFDYAFYRNGVFLTKNKQGLAICYPYRAKAKKLYDFWLKIRLVCQAISITRLKKVLGHTYLLQTIRPSHEDYLYFWFMGVVREGRENFQTAVEIMNYIFNLSITHKLPVYAETTVSRNKGIYEQLGFKTYNQIHNRDYGISVWFMSRDYRINCRWMKGPNL